MCFCFAASLSLKYFLLLLIISFLCTKKSVKTNFKNGESRRCTLAWKIKMSGSLVNW